MENIQYKTPGAMLERDPSGKLIRKPLTVTAVLPHSEENLRQAETAALPGSMQIIRCEEHEQLHNVPQEDHLQRIILDDRTTGKPFELYVEDGKLMMEVL